MAGVRELLAVTDRLGKDARRQVRKELRDAAEPVRAAAQRNYETRIGPDDDGRFHARYGVSVRKTGTVTVEQRIKSKHPRDPRYKRPKFNELQWAEALGPAEDVFAAAATKALDDTCERLRAEWIRGF